LGRSTRVSDFAFLIPHNFGVLVLGSKRGKGRPCDELKSETRVSSPGTEQPLDVRAAHAGSTGTSARFIKRFFVRYLVAVIAVALSFFMRWVIVRLYGQLPPFITFYPVILLVAMLGDIWAGLLATGLCATVAMYWELPRIGQFGGRRLSDEIGLMIFCATGVCVSVVAELYNRKRERLAAANTQLREEITERKRAEEALRAKDAELETIILKTPFMLTRCSRDFRYRYVSRAYAKMVGRTPDQIAGKPTIEIMGEKGFWTVHPHIQKVLCGETVKYEAEVCFQGVGPRHFWVVHIPDTDEHGQIIGWLTSMFDITERKQAEKALRESESRFRAFFENAAVGTSELDLSGRFVRVNQRLCDITGYKHEELLGMTPADLTHPEDRDRDWEQLSSFLRGSSPVYEAEKRYVRKDGSAIWVHATTAMIRDSEGKLLRSAGIIQDITEHKQAEEALLCTEKLAAAGRLAATIAHEVNNPLEGAMNAVFIASSNSATTPEIREMLALADQELRRAAHITQQTLGFYRETASPTPIALPS
jgi:PAS domain S-box-containing protein